VSVKLEQILDEDAGDEGRSVARIDRENASSAVEGPADAKPAISATTWEHCGAKLAKALHRKAVRVIERVGIGKSKRKFQLKGVEAYYAQYAPQCLLSVD
jgi:hypothetical protein